VSSDGGRRLHAEDGLEEAGVDMSRRSELTIGFALVIAMGCGVSNAAAQTDKYPRMAAIGQYLMEKNAEIQLARSAAPDSISRDARIVVLGRQG
jgi:hypothetical protein